MVYCLFWWSQLKSLTSGKLSTLPCIWLRAPTGRPSRQPAPGHHVTAPSPRQSQPARRWTNSAGGAGQTAPLQRWLTVGSGHEAGWMRSFCTSFDSQGLPESIGSLPVSLAQFDRELLTKNSYDPSDVRVTSRKVNNAKVRQKWLQLNFQ